MNSTARDRLASSLAANPELSSFKAALYDVPSYLDDWSQVCGGLRGQRVLEFGCGAGFISAGVALGYEPELIYGVDMVLPNELPGLLGTLNLPLPTNLVLQHQVRLTDLPNLAFDFIYAWSALRGLNMSTLVEVIAALYRATAIGGRVLVQTQQLYFASNGAQLQQYGIPLWSHLLMSRQELREALFARLGNNSEVALAALDRADNMPRVGAGTLAVLFRDAGFHLIRQYITRVAEQPPQELANIFQPQALTENQAILLFSKN